MSETTGMAQHEVTRTLVKSQPEIWTQCSDADSLGRHMSGSFGEIRITRLEPEHSVAWEGEEVSGTVRIEPSAWGTRVTLTVEVADEVADLEAASPVPQPETVAVPEPEPKPEPEPAPEAVAEPEPEALPEPVAVAEPKPEAVVIAERKPVARPEPTTTRWGRLRTWWRRAASVEPPAEEELVGPGEAVAEEWPEEKWPYEEASDPALPVEEPVIQEPAVEETAVEEPVAQAPVGPEPSARPDTDALLTAALESLGQAHHRPFSRA